MFERDKLARPYAKALFEIASASKTYKQWSAILKILSEISKNPKIIVLISDSTSIKESLVDLYIEVTDTILNEEAKNLIKLLANRRRLIVLPEIASMFEDFHNEHENRVEVEFITAVPITLEQEQLFAKKLETVFLKKINMKGKVDKSIIGGFVARAGNRVLDNSLQGQIIQLKEAMGE